MSNKLYAAATSVALITATVSLSAAPPAARAAEQPGIEAQPAEVTAVPALAVAAAAGLAATFLLGTLQGYLEAKNEQKQAANETETGGYSTFKHLNGGNIDYVLD
jgi:hypothetical protein